MFKISIIETKLYVEIKVLGPYDVLYFLQQIGAWGILVFFTLMSFGVVIPYFEDIASISLYAFHAVLYTAFAVCHVTSTLIDPAVAALRERDGQNPVPKFDRAKYNHVIENGRCHLCEIAIAGPRTKHW